MSQPVQSPPVHAFAVQGNTLARSETIGKLLAALCKAQKEFRGAPKDDVNAYERGYATLASVIEVTREKLSDNGLSLTQFPGTDANGTPYVDTLLGHESGEWICGRMAMKPEEMNPHGIGSAITYIRRYARMAVLGIAPEDDDGNGAMGERARKSTEQARQAAQEAQTKRENANKTTWKECRVKEIILAQDGDGSPWHKVDFLIGSTKILTPVWTEDAKAVDVLSKAGEKPFEITVTKQPERGFVLAGFKEAA